MSSTTVADIQTQDQQSSTSKKLSSEELPNDVPSQEALPEPKINFRCELCDLNEWCEYKGTHPPFARQIHFTEECYVMKDPFSPQPGPHSTKTLSEYFLVLGADCALCGRNVCKGVECSVFYAKTFCLHCAREHVKEFPLEIQTKIKKQLASVAASST